MYQRSNLRPAAVLIAAMAASAVAPLAAPSAEPVTTQQIRQWVDALGASEYQQRDQATRQLIDAGPSAVPAVVEAAANQNLEVTIRGVFVLQELALSGDTQAEGSAQQALEQLATQGENAAARLAREAIAQLDELRQQRAIQEFQRLGAVINPEHEEMGLFVGGIMAVEIGPDWQGTTEDLRRLRWLRDVEQVTFNNPQATNDWFSYLADMERLEIVKVRRGQVTNEGLAALKDLPRLQFLKLLYVDVDDQAIPHLKHCKLMGKVLAYGTRISEQGAQRLQESGVEVDLRKGAFLGISVPRTNEGADWFINHVTPGSAAERAGIEPGDIITRYNDRPVHDFSSLMSMIAEHDAGDTVSVEVFRRGVRFTKEITFGEWD